MVLHFLVYRACLHTTVDYSLADSKMARNWTTPCLIAVIAIQWVLFTALLQRKHAKDDENHPMTAAAAATTRSVAAAAAAAALPLDHATTSSSSALSSHAPIEGVAATVIFRAPKWFHLRYLAMLHNALVNLPNATTWKIQIFLNEMWAHANLMPWHPGLHKILAGEDTRFIVTPLPVELTKGKPKEVVMSQWFWESMAADKVVLFSGNGAFCGNQPASAWNNLVDLDYCGAPSHNHHGLGGDGASHSIRNRQAMLRVIQYAKDNDRPLRDDKNFLDTMIRINQKNVQDGKPPTFKLATPEQTLFFGGVHNLSSSAGLERLPLTVAGTQARLTWEERDSLLKHCPELKAIFPSLHEPACFGAHPDGPKCQQTICALQEEVPGHGC